MTEKAAALRDNFAFKDTDKWLWTGGASVVSNQAAIPVNSGYDGAIRSNLHYDLSASEIHMEVTQLPNVGTGSTSLSLTAQADGSNYFEFAWANGGFTAREVVAGTPNETTFSTTDTWWRIRESGGTVYWDTSSDSINWTTRRSKAWAIPQVTDLYFQVFAGYWDGAETSPGTAKTDNINWISVPASLQGWQMGALGFSAADGDTVEAKQFFDTADWLWEPIPASPVLDSDSGAIVTGLSGGTVGDQVIDSVEFGVSVVDAQNITPTTPRYSISVLNDPDWGVNPFTGYSVPIPDGTVIPSGGDGHLTIADPVSNKVFSLWQATHVGGVWGATWGGVSDLHGDGVDFDGAAVAVHFSRLAGIVRVSEIAAGEIPHALFFSSSMTTAGNVFRPPAINSDGANLDGLSTTIDEGTRIQLNPALDLTAIDGITPAELAIGKALQTYGAYCGDNGGARMSFLFELAGDAVDVEHPGDVYTNAGILWDYWQIDNIPWDQLRVLRNYDGS